MTDRTTRAAQPEDLKAGTQFRLYPLPAGMRPAIYAITAVRKGTVHYQELGPAHAPTRLMEAAEWLRVGFPVREPLAIEDEQELGAEAIERMRRGRRTQAELDAQRERDPRGYLREQIRKLDERQRAAEQAFITEILPCVVLHEFGNDRLSAYLTGSERLQRAGRIGALFVLERREVHEQQEALQKQLDALVASQEANPTWRAEQIALLRKWAGAPLDVMNEVPEEGEAAGATPEEDEWVRQRTLAEIARLEALGKKASESA